jgi:hypothetical protein
MANGDLPLGGSQGRVQETGCSQNTALTSIASGGVTRQGSRNVRQTMRPPHAAWLTFIGAATVHIRNEACGAGSHAPVTQRISRHVPSGLEMEFGYVRVIAIADPAQRARSLRGSRCRQPLSHALGR